MSLEPAGRLLPSDGGGRGRPSSPIASELLWLVVFSVTMGIFEGAVVVYLNRLLVVGELSLADDRGAARLLLGTEVLREAASLIMIAAVAALAARGFVARLARAAIIFGIWDIVYYVVLRLLIAFPATLFTWDVLFLIPRPWLGPVLAPVVVSVGLIAGGVHFMIRERDGNPVTPAPWHWALAVAGGLIVILSFVMDSPLDFDGRNYPARYRWEVFLVGFVAAVAAFAFAVRRPGRANPDPAMRAERSRLAPGMPTAAPGPARLSSEAGDPG